jgi:hypothetical protein
VQAGESAAAAAAQRPYGHGGVPVVPASVTAPLPSVSAALQQAQQQQEGTATAAASRQALTLRPVKVSIGGGPLPPFHPKTCLLQFGKFTEQYSLHAPPPPHALNPGLPLVLWQATDKAPRLRLCHCCLCRLPLRPRMS